MAKKTKKKKTTARKSPSRPRKVPKAAAETLAWAKSTVQAVVQAGKEIVLDAVEERVAVLKKKKAAKEKKTTKNNTPATPRSAPPRPASQGLAQSKSRRSR